MHQISLAGRLRLLLLDLLASARDAHRQSSETWIRRIEAPDVRRELLG
jgi:hypothetical protein